MEHRTDDLAALRADCSRCVGLCCVVPAFAASADFAVDKPAGTPCLHLRADSRCGIHGQLRQRGFPGCTVYDCFGAGQQVTQVTFGGRDWHGDAGVSKAMFAAFPLVRELHELLWYLTEALRLLQADAGSVGPGRTRALVGEVRDARDETARRARLGPTELAGLDTAAHWQAVNGLLVRTSEGVRGRYKGKNHRGRDLVGADLRRAGLRGANLRGAYLIGADLRGVDLAFADLIGADLRGADVRGADLHASIFLTQPQVNAAKGDTATRVPVSLARPGHWL